MYKAYIVNNGEVIVSYENGNFNKYDYSDNLEQILIQKNIIEAIKTKIQILSKKSENYTMPLKFEPAVYLKVIGEGILLSSFVSFLFCGGDFTSQIDTTMGSISKFGANFISCSLIVLIVVTSLLLCEDSIHREKKKEYTDTQSAMNSVLEFLHSQLIVEKEKLNDLEARTVINNGVENNCSKLIDDGEQLQKLKDLMDLYYDLGYNREKYYRYYQNGILEEKLQDEYSDIELQLANDYFQRIEDESGIMKKKQLI